MLGIRKTLTLGRLLWTTGQSYMSTLAKRLNHVAICVPNIEEASIRFSNVLGAEVSEAMELERHGVKVAFVKLSNVTLELLEPLGDKSPISGFLERHQGGGIHHLCFDVDDAVEAMERVKSQGLRLLNDEPKIGSHDTKMFFVHPKDMMGTLVEMEESPQSK